MHTMLPLAKRMLQEYGEFLPYGAAMTPEGEVVSVAGQDGRERPPSQDIINLLRKSFRESAKSNEYKATGIFFDVSVVVPGTNEKTDAIAIALDHRENYSVVLYIPYKLASGKLSCGQIFASPGSNDIFRP